MLMSLQILKDEMMELTKITTIRYLPELILRWCDIYIHIHMEIDSNLTLMYVQNQKILSLCSTM